MCPTAIKTHKIAVIEYGINIFEFAFIILSDVNVELTPESLVTLADKIFFVKNGRTSKFTKTAPTPYPKWALFNGAAALTPHIVNIRFVPPTKIIIT